MCELYNMIEKLCAQRGISGYRMCSDLGMSKSFMTELRKGRTRSATGDTVKKIAEYFRVSTDYLLSAANENQDKNLFYSEGSEELNAGMQNIDGIYLRLAREAQDLALDEEDIDTILNIYRRHREKNNG